MIKNKNFIFSIIVTLMGLIIFILLMALKNEHNEEMDYLYAYIIIYSCITIFFTYKERKNIINVKTIYVAMFTIMIGISPVIYVFYNNNSFTSPAGNSILYQFPMILMGYLAFIIGFYFPKKLKKVETKKISSKELEYSKFFALVVLVISFFMNCFLILKNRSIYLGGNVVEDSMNIYSSKGYMVYISGLYLIGIGLLYNYYYKTKKCKYLLIFFILFNTLAYIIRGGRTSVLMIFIYIVLLRNAFKPFKAETILKIGLILILGIGLLGKVRDVMSNYESSLLSNLYANLEVGSINLNYVKRVFPERTSYQYGYTFLINVQMLMPGPDDDFTIWLKKQIGLNFAGGGVTPTLIGEGYMNWGYIGVIMWPFIVGIIVSYINNLYFYNKRGIVWVTYCIVKLTDIFRGGVANSEVSLIIILCVYIVYKFGYGIFKNRFCYNMEGDK